MLTLTLRSLWFFFFCNSPELLTIESHAPTRGTAWTSIQSEISTNHCLQADPVILDEKTTEDWSSFSSYHETITKKEFCRRIDQIYNPSKAVYDYLNVEDNYVEFFEDKEKISLLFTLHLAPSEQLAKTKIAKKTFRTVTELHQTTRPKAFPLQGIRIVLDPGHIGGKWADMEERSVIWGNNPVIREGDKNLQVARLIKARLEKAGALVYMTHDKPEPVTSARPSDFLEEARQYVYAERRIDEASAKSQVARLQKLINWRAELYFYRRAEIAQRAENIRVNFLPDLNICNHFNATERSGAREMVKDNRHAFFINGCYGPDEIINVTTRFYMFSKLLEQSLDTEMAVADAISKNLLRVARLPPVKYGKEKYQCRVNDNPYLYARNLAASRQYPGPCIILEPFYMNNPWTAERLAAGDYDGVKKIAGGSYRSLFREYADAVVEAIIETYSVRTADKHSNLTAISNE